MIDALHEVALSFPHSGLSDCLAVHIQPVLPARARHGTTLQGLLHRIHQICEHEQTSKQTQRYGIASSTLETIITRVSSAKWTPSFNTHS